MERSSRGQNDNNCDRHLWPFSKCEAGSLERGIGRHLFNRLNTEAESAPTGNGGDATSLLSGFTIISAALHALFSIDLAVRNRCNQLKSHCCRLAVKWKYEIIFPSSQSPKRPHETRPFACGE